MFILYFDNEYHEYFHATVYHAWVWYDRFRPGEGFWLVPGTDPEDAEYGRFDDLGENENEGDESDETLEYMCDLLEAGEVDPSEFRRQLLSVGYHPDTISEAIASAISLSRCGRLGSCGFADLECICTPSL